MIRRAPLLTPALVLVAIAFQAVPGAAGWLQYDRDALSCGEWWRVLTAHLTHFDLNHLAWDATVLLGLGWACERESRCRMAVALGAAAFSISAALWWLQPEIQIYRGLSGLDSALFGLLAGTLLRRPQRFARVFALASLIGIGAKLAFEMRTASTLFASGAGYVPVPLAHAAGLVAGVFSAGRVPRWLASRATCRTAPSPCR